MFIKQMFTKDILRPINGVVKADQTNNATVFVELDEYVVTKELGEHFEAFFETYMPSVTDPKSKAQTGKLGIWVSGFFGSGKSHFIKILSYLLQNVAAEQQGQQKVAFDFFKEKISDTFLLADMQQAVAKQNTVILFNIDSRANTDDKEDAILKVFLKVFNETLGYSGDHPHIAHLERDLASRGLYEKFKQHFAEHSGSNWLDERDAYDFFRDDIAKALSDVTGQSAESTRQWVEQIENNFALDIANFCKWVKEYLDENNERRLLFFVDEVGQFIGNNTQMMLKLQTITENLGTICEGRAWVIVTSQEDIDAVLGQMKANSSDFSKIQGRFERLSLSSSNTNEVIEKRLLEKNTEARNELSKLYDAKGDILRNQLSFDQTTTAELTNYQDVSSFVHSYPFVPYHYTLVQKIFEAIRKAGATGLHLSRGERSLLDAFQSAAKQVADAQLGVLIPLYYFYPAIESFLDTAVKKDIDQAAGKTSISEFSVNILKTLFLIRYVDVIKSTLDNLVTLCITEVDQDKLALRRQIEQSLIALEQNLLIARQGDEYIFLTNEEKEIENEIKNTDIELSDETTELGNLIFDEILRRNNNYRYPENKQDFAISRYCNGIPRDGSVENDLVVKVLAPIDTSYADFDKTRCSNFSAEGNGCILIKLDDKARLFNELRIFIKTRKFLRMTSGNRPEQERLLRDKASENNGRYKRLCTEVEQLLKDASYFALGSELSLKGSVVSTMLDEAYRYVIENTFGKLKLVKPFSGDIKREIQNVLLADDVAQANFDFADQGINPQACLEVEKHIALNEDYGRPITADDVVKTFAKRPYGWNDDEIILILARLALANKICFQLRQQDMPLRQLYDHLMQVRKRAELRVRRIKQQSDANLKRAAKLYRELFSVNATENEKALFDEAQSRLEQWFKKLQEFKAKASTGKFPGLTEINEGLTLVAGLLDAQNSYQFIDRFISEEGALRDFEEDYQDLENFYESQFHTWQKLALALNVRFERNRLALAKHDTANNALQKLQDIYQQARPYRHIRDIEPLIEQVNLVNNSLLAEKREHANNRLTLRINRVTELLNTAHASADIKNQALRPFQLALQRIGASESIAEIHQDITEAEEWEHDAEQLINRFIETQAHQEASAATTTQNNSLASTSSAGNTSANDATAALPGQGSDNTTPANPYSIPATPERMVSSPPVKKVVSLQTSSIFNKVCSSGYLETEQDIDSYLAALKTELLALVQHNHKVRIK
ncbi:MAG: BREX system P-loop protein BrxC [Alishewanella agri]|nr:BREX system P-loop protein BrxC [Alishewanella agri]